METRPRSRRSAPWPLHGVLAAILLSGCAAAGKKEAGTAPARAPATGDDWGEDYAASEDAPHESGAFTWSIVLATFSADDHKAAAARTLGQLPQIDPLLAAARVSPTSEGSLVVYGSYDTATDAAAQRDLDWVKSLSINNRPAFPRAMLTRLKPPEARPRDPMDLMSARQRHPRVDPLYTLEVAVWGDFESGTLSREQIHANTERYARELRGRGFEAYFYHDDDKRLSLVTVGLFDRTAIDPRTGFFSPPVEALLKQFPAHLVNGAELREPIDSRHPSRGTRVQRPMLVHVPK